MHDPSIKAAAIAMRQNGASYNTISRELGIAKSTLSSWLTAQTFSEAVRTQNIARNKIRQAQNLRTYNKKRHAAFLWLSEAQIDRYRRDVPRLDHLNLFFLFMGLFWGEGSKKDPALVRISNSDPDVIRMCMRFFRENCRVAEPKFRGTVHVHARLDIPSSVRYWSAVSGIMAEKIRAYHVASSAGKDRRPAHRLPNGTFHIHIQSASLHRQIQGWLRGLRGQAAAMPK